MKNRYAALLMSCGLLACSAPESNPAVRCNAELSCEEGLVCYRGYCVDPDDDSDPPDVQPTEAGTVPPPVPSTPPVSSTPSADASVTAPDAGAPVYLDLPGGPPVAPAPVEPTPAPVTPAPVEPPPVVVTPAPLPTPAPAPTPAPTPSPVSSCIQECSKGWDEDDCEDCFEDVYGKKPEKLCGEKNVTPDMASICAAICGLNKWSVSCELAARCFGKGCKSD